jgi:hypothetical protein
MSDDCCRDHIACEAHTVRLLYELMAGWRARDARLRRMHSGYRRKRSHHD